MDIEHLEQLALSADRTTALANLLPGTVEHDYWRGVFLQHEGRLDEVDEILATWPKRHGDRQVEERRRLERRQLLLRAQKDFAKAAAGIQREAGVRFEDRAEVVVQGERLPTKLDPKLIDSATLLAEELRRRPDLSGITDYALDDVAAKIPEGDITRRRSLLQRLKRTNLPSVNVVDLIAKDLEDKSASAFGTLAIHSLLTNDQLEELAAKRPQLRTTTAWVDARLMRLRPPTFIDLRFALDERDAFLDRLWHFAKDLAPTFNSLKAQILFHRLELDRSRGVYDRARFLAYIELPRNASWVARDWLSQHAVEHLVQAHASVASGLQPIGNDEALVRDYLAHFLLHEECDAFRSRLRSELLDELLATTRLLAGDNTQAERWAKVLGPSRLAELRDRVDIELTPRNAIAYGADDDVSLEVDVKNVRELEVKVFRINSLAYFQSKNADVDTTLDLDGMIASGPERKMRFDLPQIRLSRQRIDLPACKRPGTYVVELIGNGRSSRALIRKGSLRHVVRVGAAGAVIRVMDENGAHLPDARVWLGGRELEPRKDGSGISIPFSTRSGATPILLVSGEVAQRTMLDHPAENVTLTAGMHLERESVVANQVARVICRPTLTIGGASASVTLIENPHISISIRDLAGVSSSKTQPIALHDDRETVIELNVPDGTVSIDFLLHGRVRVVSSQTDTIVSDRTTASVNIIHTTEETASLHLAKVLGPDGREVHRLCLLGKSGEPLPARLVGLTMHHRNVVDRISMRLETDADGAIDLGALDGIHTLIASPPAGGQRTWLLEPSKVTPPSTVHAAVGQDIVLPIQSSSIAKPGDFALMELRSGAPAFDRTKNASIIDRCLVIKGLTEGEYRLDGRGLSATVTGVASIAIIVARRAPPSSAGWLLAGNAMFEETPPLPLVRGMEMQGDHVVVKISGASAQTRVHVIATRFKGDSVLPSSLERPSPPPLSGRSVRSVSHYLSGRDIGEEYRYVLERRSAQRRPGTMLEKPSLLLNPWALRATSSIVHAAMGGVPYPQAASPAPMQAPFAGGSPGRSRAAEGANEQPGFPSVDFLLTGAVIVENVRPDDASGVVRIPLTELGPLAQFINVVVVDPMLTSRAELCLSARPAASRDLRLRLALDPAHHYAEDRRVDGVPSGTTIVVDDVRTGKIELVDTIARAHQLLLTLGEDEELREFTFVTEWSSLDDATKRVKYSKYACHEIHLFLWRKDRAFFDAVVRPYLAHKRHKTFIDRFLLGEDLSAFFEPWAFGHLNTVERILLAASISPVKEGISRLVGDAVDLIPRDPERDAHLVSTLLGSSALESDPSTRVAAAPMAAAEMDLFEDDTAATRTIAAPIVEKQKMAKKAERKGDMARHEPPPPPRGSPVAAGARSMSTAVGGGGGMSNNLIADIVERGIDAALFRGADKTQELAETSWWKKRIDEMGSDLITPNRFWRDLAARVISGGDAAGTPFLSPHIGDCVSSFAEAMCALAFLDLPFTGGAHEKAIEETRLTLVARSHALAARTSIVEIPAPTKHSAVLIGQSYFRSDDRWEWDGADQREKYVAGEMIVGIVYRCQVVVTNPTSTRQKLDVLLQIPRGAVPVASGFFTRTMNVQIDPYGTQSLEYAFYFPRAGRFTHFPAHVTKGLELQTSADARELEVVREPTVVDHGSWSHISQHGTTDEVIAFIDRANIGRIDLARIAWRMHDRDAFTRITKHLSARHTYDDGLWRYALMHKDPTRATEWLRHQDDFLALGGIAIDGDPNKQNELVIDPIARGWFQHLEYAPLINARAHQLGARRRILNSALEDQYKAFLDVVAHHAHIAPSDLIGAVQYLLSMDRVEDAIALLARIPQGTTEITTRLQVDYLMAYVACYRGDLASARKISTPWAAYPVDRWRNRFLALIAMLDEAEGSASAASGEAHATHAKPKAIDPDNREQKMTASAAREPSLVLEANGDELVLQHHNVGSCKLRFYKMDIELLFSRQPFVHGDVDRFSFIEPGLVLDVALTSTDGRTAIAIPTELRGANLVIEAATGTSGGLRSLITHYAHDLAIQLSPSFGQVRVLRGSSQAALPATYVKVYGRQRNGTAATFFKDGYTDLRGRFDYATLSTDDLDRVDRFAILVVSDEAGSTIVEADPPPR